MEDILYKVGIIGCGAIFIRHIESIEENERFSLVSICDIDEKKFTDFSKIYQVPGYVDYKEMIQKEDINFVVIATPNSYHFSHAKFCLENNCDVLIEKPASLDPQEISRLKKVAEKNNTKAYTVLQVRLNPSVQKIKALLDKGIIGNIRGISIIQRWQRPLEYFTGWRGVATIGGGTLYECMIHYIDILCYLFGKPDVVSSSLYNTKHKNTNIEDTIYALLDYKKFGCTLECTISCEPSNIECSMFIMTDKGYIKLGGPALDKIVEAKFSSDKTKRKYDKIVNGYDSSVRGPNIYSQYKGSCPNHPELYSEIENFDILETQNAISLISEIYGASGIKYY
tara:strand:- start:6392 stop:7408 length:1017 start_codon:yes stop_codon:yes gene_type:complete